MGNYDEPVRDRGISFVLRYQRVIGLVEGNIETGNHPYFMACRQTEMAVVSRNSTSYRFLIQVHMLRSIDLAAYRTTFCGLEIE